MKKSTIEASLNNKKIVECRQNMAKQVSCAFTKAGNEIKVFNAIDCIEKNNIEKNKLSDETRAISLIMIIAGDLVESANILFKLKNPYSASALIRQIVEVEYLAWAFENNPSEAYKWIHSNKSERQSFFTPRKLREAAGNRFRSVDYSYHCELGGHPVPDSKVLVENENNITQILLSDMILHTWRIWNHLVQWAMKYYENHPILRWSLAIIKDYDRWYEQDPLSKLPKPPSI